MSLFYVVDILFLHIQMDFDQIISFCCEVFKLQDLLIYESGSFHSAIITFYSGPESM